MRKNGTRHNQSTYYTLMLVPSSSSGETRSLRLSRRMLRCAVALLLCVVIALGVFSILAGYLGGKLRGANADLAHAKASYSEHDAKSGEEYELLPEQGELTDSERQKYNEQLESYEDRIDDLTAQLRNFGLASEEMFNLLSLNYPTVWPLNGEITLEFGSSPDPTGGDDPQAHTGIDIAVPEGTEVHATGGGTVEFAGMREDYGLLVIIDHGMGISTYYAHNSELHVSAGDTITRGQIIALSGNTGISSDAHLHYEVQVGGVAVDPRKYL